MARTVESKQLLYAYTSAYMPPGTEVAGLGVVLRTARRHTVRKVPGTVHASDRLVAAYHALILALKEAREMGARAVVAYTDSEAVIGQIDKTVRVDPEQLARHLETRSLLHQFNRAEVLLVSPEANEAAQELAEEAWRRACGATGEATLELPLTWANSATG